MKFSESTNLLILFVFGDINVHHRDWLTFSGRTDRTDEVSCNFSFWSDLTQMVNFLTWISNCDSYSPALLNLFLSDGSILSTVVMLVL